MSGPGNWTPPKQLPKGRSWADMRAEFDLGVSVFTACWQAHIPRVAIENPAMNDLARAAMPDDLPAPQIVQPHWFGEPAYKATGWYLHGLPPLNATNRIPEPARDTADWKAWNRIHRMPPTPDRGRLRSRSFPGMMRAAAQQWTDHALAQVAA